MLLELRRQLRALGGGHGDEVLDGVRVQHLAAEALTDQADAQPLAGNVDGGRCTRRALANDQHLVGVLLVQLLRLARGGTSVQFAHEVLDGGAALAELLAVQVDGRHGQDVVLLDLVLEQRALHRGMLDARVQHCHGVQRLHDGGAVLAGQGHVGDELVVAVQVFYLLDEVLVFLDRVAADLQQRQHQGAEFVAHRDACEGHGNVATSADDAEGGFALVRVVVAAGGDLVGQAGDVLQQLLQVLGGRTLVQAVHQLDVLGDAGDELAELLAQVVV